MTDSNVYPAGIDALTGKPIDAPELEEIARHVRAKLEETRTVREFLANPMDLSDAGWGILFAQSDERADKIREALRPLLEHREETRCTCGRT